eukprot:g1454.t1
MVWSRHPKEDKVSTTRTRPIDSTVLASSRTPPTGTAPTAPMESPAAMESTAPTVPTTPTVLAASITPIGMSSEKLKASEQMDSEDTDLEFSELSRREKKRIHKRLRRGVDLAKFEIKYYRESLKSGKKLKTKRNPRRNSRDKQRKEEKEEERNNNSAETLADMVWSRHPKEDKVSATRTRPIDSTALASSRPTGTAPTAPKASEQEMDSEATEDESESEKSTTRSITTTKGIISATTNTTTTSEKSLSEIGKGKSNIPVESQGVVVELSNPQFLQKEFPPLHETYGNAKKVLSKEKKKMSNETKNDEDSIIDLTLSSDDDEKYDNAIISKNDAAQQVGDGKQTTDHKVKKEQNSDTDDWQEVKDKKGRSYWMHKLSGIQISRQEKGQICYRHKPTGTEIPSFEGRQNLADIGDVSFRSYRNGMQFCIERSVSDTENENETGGTDDMYYEEGYNFLYDSQGNTMDNQDLCICGFVCACICGGPKICTLGLRGGSEALAQFNLDVANDKQLSRDILTNMLREDKEKEEAKRKAKEVVDQGTSEAEQHQDTSAKVERLKNMSIAMSERTDIPSESTNISSKTSIVTTDNAAAINDENPKTKSNGNNETELLSQKEEQQDKRDDMEDQMTGEKERIRGREEQTEKEDSEKNIEKTVLQKNHVLGTSTSNDKSAQMINEDDSRDEIVHDGDVHPEDTHPEDTHREDTVGGDTVGGDTVGEDTLDEDTQRTERALTQQKLKSEASHFSVLLNLFFTNPISTTLSSNCTVNLADPYTVNHFLQSPLSTEVISHLRPEQARQACLHRGLHVVVKKHIPTGSPTILKMLTKGRSEALQIWSKAMKSHLDNSSHLGPGRERFLMSLEEYEQRTIRRACRKCSAYFSLPYDYLTVCSNNGVFNVSTTKINGTKTIREITSGPGSCTIEKPCTACKTTFSKRNRNRKNRTKGKGVQEEEETESVFFQKWFTMKENKRTMCSNCREDEQRQQNLKHRREYGRTKHEESLLQRQKSLNLLLDSGAYSCHECSAPFIVNKNIRHCLNYRMRGLCKADKPCPNCKILNLDAGQFHQKELKRTRCSNCIQFWQENMVGSFPAISPAKEQSEQLQLENGNENQLEDENENQLENKNQSQLENENQNQLQSGEKVEEETNVMEILLEREARLELIEKLKKEAADERRAREMRKKKKLEKKLEEDRIREARLEKERLEREARLERIEKLQKKVAGKRRARKMREKKKLEEELNEVENYISRKDQQKTKKKIIKEKEKEKVPNEIANVNEKSHEQASQQQVRPIVDKGRGRVSHTWHIYCVPCNYYSPLLKFQCEKCNRYCQPSNIVYHFRKNISSQNIAAEKIEQEVVHSIGVQGLFESDGKSDASHRYPFTLPRIPYLKCKYEILSATFNSAVLKGSNALPVSTLETVDASLELRGENTLHSLAADVGLVIHSSLVVNLTLNDQTMNNNVSSDPKESKNSSKSTNNSSKSTNNGATSMQNSESTPKQNAKSSKQKSVPGYKLTKRKRRSSNSQADVWKSKDDSDFNPDETDDSDASYVSDVTDDLKSSPVEPDVRLSLLTFLTPAECVSLPREALFTDYLQKKDSIVCVVRRELTFNKVKKEWSSVLQGVRQYRVTDVEPIDTANKIQNFLSIGRGKGLPISFHKSAKISDSNISKRHGKLFIEHRKNLKSEHMNDLERQSSAFRTLPRNLFFVYKDCGSTNGSKIHRASSSFLSGLKGKNNSTKDSALTNNVDKAGAKDSLAVEKKIFALSRSTGPVPLDLGDSVLLGSQSLRLVKLEVSYNSKPPVGFLDDTVKALSGKHLGFWQGVSPLHLCHCRTGVLKTWPGRLGVQVRHFDQVDRFFSQQIPLFQDQKPIMEAWMITLLSQFSVDSNSLLTRVKSSKSFAAQYSKEVPLLQVTTIQSNEIARTKGLLINTKDHTLVAIRRDPTAKPLPTTPPASVPQSSEEVSVLDAWTGERDIMQNIWSRAKSLLSNEALDKDQLNPSKLYFFQWNDGTDRRSLAQSTQAAPQLATQAAPQSIQGGAQSKSPTSSTSKNGKPKPNNPVAQPPKEVSSQKVQNESNSTNSVLKYVKSKSEKSEPTEKRKDRNGSKEKTITPEETNEETVVSVTKVPKVTKQQGGPNEKVLPQKTAKVSLEAKDSSTSNRLSPAMARTDSLVSVNRGGGRNYTKARGTKKKGKGAVLMKQAEYVCFMCNEDLSKLDYLRRRAHMKQCTMPLPALLTKIALDAKHTDEVTRCHTIFKALECYASQQPGQHDLEAVLEGHPSLTKPQLSEWISHVGNRWFAETRERLAEQRRERKRKIRALQLEEMQASLQGRVVRRRYGCGQQAKQILRKIQAYDAIIEKNVQERMFCLEWLAHHYEEERIRERAEMQAKTKTSTGDSDSNILLSSSIPSLPAQLYTISRTDPDEIVRENKRKIEIERQRQRQKEQQILSEKKKKKNDGTMDKTDKTKEMRREEGGQNENEEDEIEEENSISCTQERAIHLGLISPNTPMVRNTNSKIIMNNKSANNITDAKETHDIIGITSGSRESNDGQDMEQEDGNNDEEEEEEISLSLVPLTGNTQIEMEVNDDMNDETEAPSPEPNASATAATSSKQQFLFGQTDGTTSLWDLAT